MTTTRRVLCVPVLLATALVTAACSFILDVEGPPDPPPAAPDDAASAPDGAALPDAADGGGPDASSSLCGQVGTVAFCDDFEREGDPGGGSWAAEVDPGAALAIQTENENRLLRASVPASASATRAVLRRAYGAPPTTRIRFVFSARFASLPSSAIGTMGVVLGAAPNARSIVLYAGAGGFTISEIAPDGAVVSYPLDVPVPTGRFTTIDMRVSFVESPPRIDLLVDGQVALSRSAQAGLVAAPPAFVVGLSHTAATPAFAVDVDDVIVDFD